MTALHTASKSDTILLLDYATGDIFEDKGPERTNLDDQTTYLDETPSARAAVGAPRNITIKLQMQSGWSGVLLELGRGAGNYSYRVSLSAGVLSFAEETLLRAAVTVPGLTGSDRLVLINWSQRVEGANVIDEIAVGNLTTGEWAFGRGSHTALVPVSTDDLTVSAAAGGASTYTGTIAAYQGVHIGRRLRTAAEAFEDWGTLSAVPTFDGFARDPLLTGSASELVIANEGSLTGPSYLLSGAATRQAAQRGVGAFVNLSIRSPNAELIAASPVRFYKATPDGVAGWQWCIRYLWHGYLSPKVNVARVRIHVRAYDSMGGGATISPVRFRSYSIADLPLNGAPSVMTYNRGAITSITAVSVAGVWVDLGLVTLSRDAKGLSYFALGFLIDSEGKEGITFVTAWKLNAITVEPYAKDLAEGGKGGDLDLVTP
jgi:hypothetical protein